MKKEFLKKTIIKKGSCLTPRQKEEGYKMDFILTDDGVLTISGNSHLCPIPAPDAIPYFDDDPAGPPSYWSKYVSQFKDMDFHTVIIEDGVTVLSEHCFKDCKALKKIILPEHVPTIRYTFAEGSSLEYTVKDNLKFLGPPSNPLFYLRGATDDYNEDRLIIPEGTVRIADEAFKNKKFIKEIVVPESLEFLGWYTFEGTSIKELFLPEGKLAYDETLIAFEQRISTMEGKDSKSLETISLPYSMYKTYKEGLDPEMVEAWNTTRKIIFRNPDDSIAEVLEPQPLENYSHTEETKISTIETNSDELPF